MAVISILILCGVGYYYLYPRWEAVRQNRAQLFPMPTTYQSSSETDSHPVAVPSVIAGSKTDQESEKDASPQETVNETLPASQATHAADADLVSAVEKESIAAVSETAEPIKVPAGSSGLTATLTAGNDTGNQEPDRQVASPPVLLGQMRVHYGDTLYKMITHVYGAFRTSHLTALMKANPQIVDPDAIDTGQWILFPAIGFKPNPLLAQCAWIVLDRRPALDQAITRWKQLASRERLAVQMIAGWSAEEELQFYLALRGYFATGDKALSFKNVLPETMATQARIIIDWPAKTTLFGDPYIGGVQ